MKKYIITSAGLLLSWQTVFSQNFTNGLTLDMALTSDLAQNVYGGNQRGSAYLSNIDLSLDFDTEKANLWTNGQFFVQLINNHGNSLSELTGDRQGISNIEAPSSTMLYQLWYKHQFKKVSITIGQHDLNADFANTDFGSLFINGSFGIQHDISANVAASLFPLTTFGGIIQWKINDHLRLLNAVYDGDPGNPEAIKFFNFEFKKSDGLLTINELQYHNNTTNGTYKLGFYYHTSRPENDLIDHTNGIYFITDQNIYKTSENKNLNAFLQLGIAPDGTDIVHHYLGGGLVYQGICRSKTEDSLGLAVAHTSFNNHLSHENLPKYETVIEATCHMKIRNNFYIQPDIQYVINSKMLSSTSDALVVLMRLKYEL